MTASASSRPGRVSRTTPRAEGILAGQAVGYGLRRGRLPGRAELRHRAAGGQPGHQHDPLGDLLGIR